MSAHPPARQALEALDGATLSLLVLSLRHGRSDEALGELLLLEPEVVAQRRRDALRQVAQTLGSEPAAEELAAALGEIARARYAPDTFHPPQLPRTARAARPARAAPTAPRVALPQLPRIPAPAPRTLAIALVTAVAIAGAAFAVSAATGGGGQSKQAARPAAPRVRHPAAADRATAAQRTAVARFARLGYPLYCGARRGRYIALTFDDGPGPYTPLALRKLRAAHVPATFFIVGRNIPSFPGTLKRELGAGGVLGDHTWNHILLTQVDEATTASEIGRTQDAIEHTSGRQIGLFRPPYGAMSDAAAKETKKRGLLPVLWDVDTRDSEGNDYAAILHAAEIAKPGAIVLMHENHGQTIRALTSLLPYLRHHGWTPVTVPELLVKDPPTRAQLRAGPAGCGLGTTSPGD